MLWTSSEACQTKWWLMHVSRTSFGRGLEDGLLAKFIVSLPAAALPPDVRKGFAFPVKFKITVRGYPTVLRGVAFRSKEK